MGSELARPPGTRRPPSGCAGRARNPKGPQITPFCHQMARHPTIWDFKTGIRLRIPARISPWGSQGLNPNFLFHPFWTQKCPKVDFLAGFRIYPRPIAMDLGPQGPKGAHGGPRGPMGPLGPLGPPWAPNPLLQVADKFETLPENILLAIFGSKISEKNWDLGPGTPTARSGLEF